jgi:hypothetical protein
MDKQQSKQFMFDYINEKNQNQHVQSFEDALQIIQKATGHDLDQDLK